MKAVVCRAYGPPDLLRVEEVEKPTASGDQVLIRVRAASVNPLDSHLMRGDPYVLRMMGGLRRPKDTRVGVDVAGEVEAVGPTVTQIKAGDQVFGSCRGAFAEYACAAESAVVTKPGNVSFDQAASAPVAAMTALQGLRDAGQLRQGQKVLVNGAAGGVGTFAVQVAKWLGAEVTGVCSSRNVEMVRSLGADRVIDYTRSDFTTDEARYDIVLDCVGNHSLSETRRVLGRKGTYVLVGAQGGGWISPLDRLLKAKLLSPLVSQKLTMVMTKGTKADLTIVRDLLESGTLTPVIDRCYGLAEVVEAMRYLEQGHARGKVIVNVP